MIEFDDFDETMSGMETSDMEFGGVEAFDDFDESMAAAVDMEIPTEAHVDKTEEVEVDAGEDTEVIKRLQNINLEIAGIDTGYKVVDVLGDDGAAALVGMGHMMIDTYRGAKQALGFDVEEEAFAEDSMNQLYRDKEVGVAATVGAVAGAVTDPASVALGLATGGAGVLMKIDRVSKAIAVGAGAGAVTSALGYSDIEEGDSLLDARIKQAGIGGVFGGSVGAVVGKADLARVGRKFAQYEYEVASRVNAGATIDDAIDAVSKADPALAKYISGVQKGSGLSPDLDTAVKNFKVEEELARGLGPADVIAKSSAGRVRNGIDVAIGTISSRVKNISPAVHSKLRKYDAAISFRPEEYRQRRSPFADYFTSRTGRKQKAKVAQFSKEETRELNKLLINGKMDEAETMIESLRGPEALKAFKEARAVLDDLGDQLVEHGVIKEKITNYWPRTISNDTKEEFLTALKKDNPQFNKDWTTKLAQLNSKSQEKLGRNLTAQEENQAFMNFIFGGNSSINHVGLAKNRKMKQVADKFLEFYEDPLQSMDSFIHRSIGEIEKSKFFGKSSYVNATKNPGVFDELEALDQLQLSDDFAKLDPIDQLELRDLLRTRFGKGIVNANKGTQTYKAIVNMTLLGNPFSAMTQLGDLGVSMYKNGVRRTLINLFKKSGVKVDDLGLESRFQEFEDIAPGGRLGKWQDFMFKWSGFRTVDKIGKETFVNSALDNAAAALKKNPTSRAYRKWQSDAQQRMGNDFSDFKNEFSKWIEGGKNPEDLTDNILTYSFSKLADIQPISKSEMPAPYLKSNWGKAAYTLKSFMLKQVDILRNDAYNKIIVGNRNKNYQMMAEGAANFVRYFGLVGSANLGVEKIRDLVSGKISLEELDEEVQAITAASFLAAGFRTFGISEYTAKEAERAGISGIVSQYMPPFPIADELARIAGSIATAEDLEDVEKDVAKQGRRIWRYIPGVGRSRQIEEAILGERDSDTKVSMFAEGGLVEAEESKVPLEEAIPEDPSPSEPEEQTPKEVKEEGSESKAVKLDPGVYEDESGKYFRVTEDGDITELELS